MPLLDMTEQRRMLQMAKEQRLVCAQCGERTALDYCRSCDEFYWLHDVRCPKRANIHGGHRLTIVPFVETR